MKKIYIFYEENYNSLLSECDSVDEMKAFEKLEDAADLVRSSVEQYQADGFIPDKEADIEAKLSDTTEESPFFLMMFLSRQENWNESFSLNIKVLPIL